MDNYDSTITQLGKQVAEFAPKSSPNYLPSKMLQWRSYYAYILIPISVIVILLVWRPGFMMYENDEGKRRIKFKSLLIASTVISVVFVAVYVFYRLKISG